MRDEVSEYTVQKNMAESDHFRFPVTRYTIYPEILGENIDVPSNLSYNKIDKKWVQERQRKSS